MWKPKSLLIVPPWTYGYGKRPTGEREPQRAVWRIMVPKAYNNGRRIPASRVRKWERLVVGIGGGYTAYPTAKGAWREREGSRTQTENMRPVDILCSEPQISEIAAITAEHFKQKAVLAYKVCSIRDVKWFQRD